MMNWPLNFTSLPSSEFRLHMFPWFSPTSLLLDGALSFPSPMKVKLAFRKAQLIPFFMCYVYVNYEMMKMNSGHCCHLQVFRKFDVWGHLLARCSPSCPAGPWCMKQLVRCYVSFWTKVTRHLRMHKCAATAAIFDDQGEAGRARALKENLSISSCRYFHNFLAFILQIPWQIVQ